MSQLVRRVVAYKKGDAVTVETVVVPDPGRALGTKGTVGPQTP